MWKILMRSWNEADHIRNGIESIPSCIDEIIISDGAYRYYPYNMSPVYTKPYSTDGTLDIVKGLQEKMGDRLVLLEHTIPFASEYINMGKILRDHGKEGDYFVLLDPHEIITGNLQSTLSLMEHGRYDIGDTVIRLTNNRDSTIRPDDYFPTASRRILRWHPRIRLQRTHKDFYYPEPPKVLKCFDVAIYHYKRNDEREFMNSIHREQLKKFFVDEIKLLQYRRKHKILDGYVDIELPERSFDPYVESGLQSMERG